MAIDIVTIFGRDGRRVAKIPVDDRDGKFGYLNLVAGYERNVRLLAQLEALYVSPERTWEVSVGDRSFTILVEEGVYDTFQEACLDLSYRIDQIVVDVGKCMGIIHDKVERNEGFLKAYERQAKGLPIGSDDRDKAVIMGRLYANDVRILRDVQFDIRALVRSVAYMAYDEVECVRCGQVANTNSASYGDDGWIGECCATKGAED